jgi:hypothetical protein
MITFKQPGLLSFNDNACIKAVPNKDNHGQDYRETRQQQSKK